jgi:HAMP domain-containing protein
MAARSGVRGTGIRLTLPFLFRYSALWLIVTVLTGLLFGIASYLATFSRPEGDGEPRQFLLVIAAQTLFLIVALVALAIFTTHRLAGPYIALKRAFEAVKQGDLEHPLRLRSTDLPLQELEASFNEMLAVLRGRIQGSGAQDGQA